jgi:hypothetical protein
VTGGELSAALEALEDARERLLSAATLLATFTWSRQELMKRGLPNPAVTVRELALETSLLVDLLTMEEPS